MDGLRIAITTHAAGTQSARTGIRTITAPGTGDNTITVRRIAITMGITEGSDFS